MVHPTKIVLSVALAIAAPLSHGASTELTDTPLPVISSVAPNIMFVIDDSGSMSHIVVDTPYDASVTYSTCTTPAAPFDQGSATVIGARSTGYEFGVGIWKDGSGTYVRVDDGSVNYYSYDAAANRCFNPNLYYLVTSLNATYDRGDAWRSNTSNGTSIYTGNYLNWFFCTGTAPNCNSATNFGGGAQRKPGTKTRLEVVKESAKEVITGLGNVRVGLTGYAGDAGGSLKAEVKTLDATHRTTLETQINNLSNINWTPLAETMADVGRYFTLGYPSTSNLKLHPSSASPSNETVATVFNNHSITNATGNASLASPIQYWCQKSFAVLMTDGLPTQDQSISSHLKEYYGYCTSNPSNCTGNDGKRKKMVDTSGTITATDEFYETSNSSDYLDDVANALYDIDLRPDLVPTSGTKTNKNNLLTYTIGFSDPMLATTTVLRRAAQYGGGLSLTAGNASALTTAFQSAADDILAKDGSAAAVAVANAHVTNTDNASYSTSYNSGTWSGDLVAYPINTTTGVPNINTPIWDSGCTTPGALVDPADASKGVLGCSAQTLLDLKTASSRKIFTSNDTSTCRSNCGIPFQPSTASGTAGVDKLSTAQLTRLRTPSSTDGDAVVAYLRGDKSGETAGTYRSRAHILGDTVDAEPLVIREPDRNYLDTGYTTYRQSNDTRQRLVIQASNDGMVHAFNSLTGQEEWAYVPDILISSANDPANSSTALLNTRTRRSNFTHYFLIDGTPVTGDVDFNNTDGSSGSPDWRTMIVGGFGKGARGYYALDVTSPTATSESNAALKALWEFPRSIVDTTARTNAFANLGYTFGKPIIVKTEAKGWVVLVTSGYNNGTDTGGDGKGHLYVINPKTGDLIADLVTPQCNEEVTASTANSQAYPCGLTHVNAYVESRDANNTAEYAYAGDLYGNVWRFKLTGASTSDWTVTKMATLRAGNTGTSTRQPITSVPELAKIDVGGGTFKYFVYVGTGQYLGKPDLPCPPSPATCAWTPNAQSTQTQSMYGLVDPRDGTTLPDPLLGSLTQQTYTTNAAGTSRTFSTNSISFTGGSAKKGWYVNFAGGDGERIVTDPALAVGTLVFTTNIPNTTPCIPGGSSWIYAIDYKTGGQVDGASWGGQKLATALASRPVLVQLPNGQIKALTRLSDATTVTTTVPTSGTASAGKRVSWRELLED